MLSPLFSHSYTCLNSKNERAPIYRLTVKAHGAPWAKIGCNEGWATYLNHVLTLGAQGGQKVLVKVRVLHP
jgi:hypothetical protein